MECIDCTQCIDACDAVMDRIGRPRGLDPLQLAGRARRRSRGASLRPRVVVYPLLLAVVWGALVYALAAPRRPPT